MSNIDAGDDLAVQVVPFSGLHKLSILRAIRKRKLTLFLLWLGISVLAIIFVQRLPSIYRAEAVVLVDSQKIPESFVSPAVSGELPDRLALISEHIMTSARLLDIIYALNLYPEGRKHLTQDELLHKMREDISVSFEKSWTGGRMQAFRLSYEGPGAQLTTRVANRLASLYVAENARAREAQAEDTVDFLSRKLQEAKLSLDEQEGNVAQFKQDHNGSLPEQESSLLATINSLSVQLQGVQSSIARAQESELSLEAALSAASASDASLRASLGYDLNASARSLPEAARALHARSIALTEKIAIVRATYTPDHPSVQALERELAEINRQAAELAKAVALKNSAPATAEALAEDSAANNSPAVLQSREQLTLLRSQIDVGKHQITYLEAQRVHTLSAIADAEARIQRLPLVEQEMASLKRNYEQSASTYNSLLQKKLAAGIATDMERSQKSERFAVSDPARTPQLPVKPQRALIILAASLVGFLLGVAVVLLLEIRKDKFQGEWELPSSTVILGRVPAIVRVSKSKDFPVTV